jgi:acyl-[acyl-carrier-protein]-phospholipid O-acyltransferase/long-chain-fatty-acid--[acyl-carrier-protein] ligase
LINLTFVAETAPVASSNIPNALVPKYWKIQQGQKTGTIGKPLYY